MGGDGGAFLCEHGVLLSGECGDWGEYCDGLVLGGSVAEEDSGEGEGDGGCDAVGVWGGEWVGDGEEGLNWKIEKGGLYDIPL